MSIRDRVDQEIKTAMRAKSADRVGTLRLIKSEFKKFEIDENKELDDAAAQTVLGRMAKQRRDSIEQFRAGNREDLAVKEEAELAVIGEFLPEALNESELDEIIEGVLAEIGPVDASKSGPAIGKVMGAVKATGKSFDGKEVNRRVRERLES